MRRAATIEKESEEITTVRDLTEVFESIASTHVAKVRNKVELSTNFFKLLWSKYKSIRIDPRTRITNRELAPADAKKVFIIISAEAGLSGNIDQRLVETMLLDYDRATTDIIVLGAHGASQLTQRDIKYVRHFQVPETDKYLDVSPIIEAVIEYSHVIVYYEEYVSLGVQEVKKIDLISSMKTMSETDQTDNEGDERAMTAADTLFEPSLEEIADQMEVTMMTLALSQAILESSLAQAASRFNAMAVAKKRASELLYAYRLEYHRAKRSESDRRLREVMVGIKRKKARFVGGGI